MKIVQFNSENFKRLVAVEIKPDGNLVEITGKNGAGKTSVLDAIWAALAGADVICREPIRKGETEARIRLDLGEIIVTRTFRRRAKDGEITTLVKVEAANGAMFPTPQKMLDSLLDALCFDPLEFARMKAKDQFNALRKFVPGIDFDMIAAQNRGDRERRAVLTANAKQERGAAAVIIVPKDVPAEEVDEMALVDELSKAGQFNADIEERERNRLAMSDRIRDLRVEVAKKLGSIDASVEGLKSQFNHNGYQIAERIKRLEAELAREREALRQHTQDEQRDIAALITGIKDGAAQMETQAAELQAKLENAEALPALKDLAILRGNIEKARATNELVRKATQRAKHEKNAERLEADAQAITNGIEAREQGKQAAIAAAEMPVPGIGFGDELVLLNGVPFDQGSDAEQLQASVRIAMKLAPKVRVLRIRDGSLLDTDAMKLLATLADDNDMQVWIERVDSSGKIGFVIEDGHARKASADEAQAAAS